ncbi:hypothetical protein HHK36_027541 [Tetracentron sinense]|uniref:protein-serine/threonine phosphatase n=1 Tax=Tetracentron sinense TaxID=13715 RepID=A0A834YHY4_TETSI|nr:hypothetical protein HHK36_027541 [Tetracentron sinense]
MEQNHKYFAGEDWMPEPGMVSGFRMKKSRNGRRRRLESVCGFENLFNGDSCVKNRRTPSNEANTVAKRRSVIGLGSELSPASSVHSSEKAPMPVGILVDGGEVCEREEDLRSFTCLSHGSISVIGRRREMEDAVTVVPEFLCGEFASYDFFAVYDGHGGSRVAQVCRDRLHRVLAKEIEGREVSEPATGKGEVEWEKVMGACFSKMDDEVNGDGFGVEDGSASELSIGSTAVVALVGKEELVVANCGDSRAVLYRGGAAVPLSHDHKVTFPAQPDRPDEMERVEAAGGRVINWDGYRVLGVLATSRSIGDHYLKPYVISDPEVIVSERTVADEFLILASDGLWDVVSNEVACEVVGRCLDGRMMRRFSGNVRGSCATEAAAVLAELAMARGSKDNISVIVIMLKNSSGSFC